MWEHHGCGTIAHEELWVAPLLLLLTHRFLQLIQDCRHSSDADLQNKVPESIRWLHQQRASSISSSSTSQAQLKRLYDKLLILLTQQCSSSSMPTAAADQLLAGGSVKEQLLSQVSNFQCRL